MDLIANLHNYTFEMVEQVVTAIFFSKVPGCKPLIIRLATK